MAFQLASAMAFSFTRSLGSAKTMSQYPSGKYVETLNFFRLSWVVGEHSHGRPRAGTGVCYDVLQAHQGIFGGRFEKA